jgi:hypothetical protein
MSLGGPARADAKKRLVALSRGSLEASVGKYRISSKGILL